jgi:hypothetical protein
MAHKQQKDAKMSESGAKDVRKTPGKGSKMPPMPAGKMPMRGGRTSTHKGKKGY